MSKEKLIELIKMHHHKLDKVLIGMCHSGKLKELQEIMRMALKEQDHDTRRGCSEAMLNVPEPENCMCESVEKIKAHAACMNYQDKDLEGLLLWTSANIV